MHITMATAAGLVLAELIEEEDNDDVILSPLAQSIAVRLLVAARREMNNNSRSCSLITSRNKF